MKKIAENGLVIIFSLLTLFHILILTGVIPMDIVWGGRLESIEEMRRFETISLTINLILLLFALGISGIIPLPIHTLVRKIVLYVMIVLFSLNTLGNLLSNNLLEKIAFTPITILLVVFCVVLVKERS